MQGFHVSTNEVALRDAFAYWQDVICETFIHLDCTSPNKNRFSGGLYNQPFGRLQLSSMASDEIDLRRSPARIAAAREDHCLIVVQGRGRTFAEQDGRQAILDTNDLALFDSIRPYDAQLRAGFHHFVLKIPREALRRRLGPLEAMTATRISGKHGIGRLVSTFVRGLADELDTMDAATAERTAETCIDLIAAALGSAVPNAVMGESTTRVARLVQAKAYIAAHAQHCELSPGQIAHALGISPRYLADLFATEGTSTARFIWALRIERCKAALADPAQAHRSISEIAFAWGFSDMSHFSRLFRAHVGVAPRDYRETGAEQLGR